MSIDNKDFPQELQYNNEQIDAIDSLHTTHAYIIGAHDFAEILKKEFGWSDTHAVMCIYRMKFLKKAMERQLAAHKAFDDSGANDITWKRLNYTKQ